jgi:hypothetical protein
MNELNELEAQLRAWAPRRPSPRLEDRIFHSLPIGGGAVAGAGQPQPLTRRPLVTWLAPATAALLLVGVVLNQRNGPSFTVTRVSTPMVAMAMSNQSAAAFLPGSFSHDVNGLPAETFEWTNGSGSTSSISSLSGRRGMN